jgi:hypothetical protein
LTCSSWRASSPGAGGRLHGEEADDLQHVVLDDVADGPDLLVEAPAPFHTERFRHGDLHVVDIVAVPDRLQERVRKTEIEEILHGLLGEVVVDAKDIRLLERRMQRSVECPGRAEVASERLLDHHACARRTPRRAQALDDRRKQTGWDGEIVERPGGLPQRRPEPDPRRRIAIIAGDVVEP